MVRRPVVWGVSALLAAGLVTVAVLIRSSHHVFEPPERQGPPALVQSTAGPRLWLATRQVERQEYSIGETDVWILETRHHLRLQAHDPVTAHPLWQKDLAVVVERSRDEQVVNAGPIRLLGQQDHLVWTWVHDQLLALSADDGSVRADRTRLEQANPALAGLFPTRLDEYAWYGAVIVTLADGRRVRLTLPDFRAEPWSVPEGEAQAFDRAASMSHTYWGGAFATADFGVRHTVAGGRWVGLLSEREARNAEDDARGDHFAGSEWIDDEGRLARRGFWLVTATGQVEARAAMQPRITRLERLPGTGEYLQGRMLKALRAAGDAEWQQRDVRVRPAPREPLRLADPDGVLVLFRTRLDEQGQLALARTDGEYRERWRVLLPIDELQNRWQVGTRVLLMGSAGEAPGTPGAQRREILLSLAPATGTWTGWDVGAERRVGPVQ